MAELIAQVRTALLGDVFFATAVENRVYTRRLKKRGNRATPEAFDINGIVKLSAVVTDDGDVPDVLRINRATQLISVWLHGPDTTEARGIITETLVPYLDRIVIQTNYVGVYGTGIEATRADRLGLTDDPDLPDGIVDYVRFGFTKLWRIIDDE